MIVTVKVNESSLKISVGDGKQSFKWLASVIASRIKENKKLRSLYEQESYIVTELRNASDELLNPADYLYEHAGQGGLTVSATLATSFPTDEWENPNMNHWMKASYVHSEVGSHWAEEIDAWRDSLERMKETNGTNILVQRALPPQSNLIQINGYSFTEADINSAFDLDWGAMKWNWLSPTDHQKNLIGDVLKSHYTLICNIFAHYCGLGKGKL